MFDLVWICVVAGILGGCLMGYFIRYCFERLSENSIA